MGFTDLVSDAGLGALNSFLQSRSYIVGQSASQADATIYKALSGAPDATKYPHAARWYKHITSHQSDFETLPGDKSTDISQYGGDVTPAAVNPAAAPDAEEDDDDDLFASDDEEEDQAKAELTKKRLEEYNAKKALKPKTIAKSVVTLEVKPWDDETDLQEMEKSVRSIDKDGLVWGASTFIAVGYGIKKLQINLVIEDEKISLTDLQTEIEENFEDHVQSTDVAAMQKL